MKGRAKGAKAGHQLLKRKADALTAKFRMMAKEIRDVRPPPPRARRGTRARATARQRERATCAVVRNGVRRNVLAARRPPRAAAATACVRSRGRRAPLAPLRPAPRPPSQCKELVGMSLKTAYMSEAEARHSAGSSIK